MAFFRKEFWRFLSRCLEFPLVRGTSIRKCKFVLELCKGHHSKRTGHHGTCCGLFPGLPQQCFRCTKHWVFTFKGPVMWSTYYLNFGSYNLLETVRFLLYFDRWDCRCENICILAGLLRSSGPAHLARAWLAESSGQYKSSV